MSRLLEAAAFGLLIGFVGLLISFFPVAHDLEEDIGLGLLFKLRGARKPPSEVVVVSIDRESTERLKVSSNPDRWPRSIHAELISNLVREGARVIVLDIYFIEPRSGADDASLAAAIQQARNVVLAEPLRAEEVGSLDTVGSRAGHLIVKKLQTVESISKAAFATAPFVLPRMPLKVSQYWAFQTSAGDTPTFPIVAFQLSALSVYNRFWDLIEKVSPSQAVKLPRDAAAMFKAGSAVRLIREIREIFESDPTLAEKMMTELDRVGPSAYKADDYRLIKSLVRVYGGNNRRYLNFYGPPRTITTIPYDQALRLGQDSDGGSSLSLKGKTVFVGYSEILLAERQDSFHTVFSQANGVFISGVEIAATAFANLLEDAPVKMLSYWSYLLLILMWGVVVGLICRTNGAIAAAMILVTVSGFYLGFADYRFKVSGVWYPLVVPLCLQAPVGLLAAILVSYFETNRERQNVRSALGYYVPSDVVNQLAQNIVDMRRSGQTVYGACLFADAAGYTSLSETMGPRELSDLMHKYFEVTFEAIKKNRGLVVELKGDSIIALWKAQRPDSALGKRACAAALDLANAVSHFNQTLANVKLPTRIAVHAGEFFLGNIGAGDHYEYGVTGDTVNTVSRLDGLNKYLETKILVSHEVVGESEEFLTREAGSFLLKGKAQPVLVYELLGRAAEPDDQRKQACTIFSEALRAFKARTWVDAATKFHRCIDILGEDGLSRFYLKLCVEYQANPPGEQWKAVIPINEK
jgi:adenylate cyclase